MRFGLSVAQINVCRHRNLSNGLKCLTLLTYSVVAENEFGICSIHLVMAGNECAVLREGGEGGTARWGLIMGSADVVTTFYKALLLAACLSLSSPPVTSHSPTAL